MTFEFSGNEYDEYLKNKYINNFTKVNIKFIENGREEIHQVVIPMSWLDSGYVAIDYDGGVTVFDTYPTEHLFSKTWDINDIDDDFVEIGTINRLVSDWQNMLQPIGNANFVL